MQLNVVDSADRVVDSALPVARFAVTVSSVAALWAVPE
jgi:hypothetical protein